MPDRNMVFGTRNVDGSIDMYNSQQSSSEIITMYTKAEVITDVRIIQWAFGGQIRTAVVPSAEAARDTIRRTLVSAGSSYNSTQFVISAVTGLVSQASNDVPVEVEGDI